MLVEFIDITELDAVRGEIRAVYVSGYAVHNGEEYPFDFVPLSKEIYWEHGMPSAYANEAVIAEAEKQGIRAYYMPKSGGSTFYAEEFTSEYGHKYWRLNFKFGYRLVRSPDELLRARPITKRTVNTLII